MYSPSADSDVWYSSAWLVIIKGNTQFMWQAILSLHDRSQLLIQAGASLDGSYCSVAYLKTYSVAPVQCEPREGE